jgi:transposase
MERRHRRSFTNDYNRQAVDLVASSSRSVGSVAKELGPLDLKLLRLHLTAAGTHAADHPQAAAPSRAVASDEPQGLLRSCAYETPRSLASRTASSLNSREYCLLSVSLRRRPPCSVIGLRRSMWL